MESAFKKLVAAKDIQGLKKLVDDLVDEHKPLQQTKPVMAKLAEEMANFKSADARQICEHAIEKIKQR